MTVLVQTKTNCDVCNAESIRAGAEGSTPPVDWFSAELTQRHEGSGWSNSTRVKAVLCPSCAFKIADILNSVGRFRWSSTPSAETAVTEPQEAER